ncbi:MAG TPA: AAA family ATPase, partial [Acidobacteriota bacterium]|nr:AAA family ATPase [Acidobacteriota bacterium]
ELGLISGYSGIGKSALVQELFKPITEERGYFISGKFNQFQRNVPYASVIQAFQSLIRQILTESESQIAQWRQELTEALGINGELITAVIPEVELIIGPQPPVVSLGPTETRNRFNLVFQNFIRVFAQADHPLVLFLDDLQWADPDSLKLIGTLISANDIQHLLVLGAYRDNEVDPGHPLMMMLHEAQKNSAQITDIKLTPLGVQQVTALVADTLNQSPETVAPLAELVFGKAAGNPFFTSEFLKHLNQDRLIWFDPEPAEWVWEIDQIRTAQITDNVVELITDNIQRLGPATVEVLTMAACLGNQFDLLKLSLVTNKTERKIISDLREAVREGLILPLGDGYQVIEYGILADRTSETIECKFAHDRIQQAV